MDMLKKLRALTHAPMNDCKRALEEWWNDLSAAQERLKERWAIKAAKNADRETNEGIVLVTNQDWIVVWLKLACETDFVAKNDVFKSLAAEINDKVRSLWREISSLSDLSETEILDLNKVLQDNFVTVGENMQIIDVFRITKNAYVYTHGGSKVCAVVFYDGKEEVAKVVALQVAAMNPQYFSRTEIPTEVIDDLKKGIQEELVDSKKPVDIQEKILAGRVNKHLGEIVLLEQVSITDDSKKIKDLLEETLVTWYIRYSI